MANTLTILVCAAAAAAAPVWAQVPKEGRLETTLCFGGPVHVLQPAANDRFGSYVVTGGMHASEGPFSALSLECVGVFEYRAGGAGHQGYCVYQDASGDKIYGKDASSAQGYTWEYLGGTGKFAGISGSGTIERLGAMKPVREGTMQACRRVVGSYKLP